MGSRSLCVDTGCKNGTSCLLFPNQGRNTTQAAPECRTFRLHEKVPMRVTHLPRRLHSRSCWRTETRTTRQLPTGISFIFCHLLPPLVSRLSSLLSLVIFHHFPIWAPLCPPFPTVPSAHQDTGLCPSHPTSLRIPRCPLRLPHETNKNTGNITIINKNNVRIRIYRNNKNEDHEDFKGDNNGDRINSDNTNCKNNDSCDNNHDNNPSTTSIRGCRRHAWPLQRNPQACHHQRDLHVCPLRTELHAYPLHQDPRVSPPRQRLHLCTLRPELHAFPQRPEPTIYKHHMKIKPLSMSGACLHTSNTARWDLL